MVGFDVVPDDLLLLLNQDFPELEDPLERPELEEPLDRDEPEKLDEREGDEKLLRPELNDPPPLANTLRESKSSVAKRIFFTRHFQCSS